jgi:hypothetical protein
MVNWNTILSNRNRINTVKQWATGNLTTSNLKNTFKGSEAGSEVNGLLRKHGTMYGRRICRKALRRRNLLK